MTIKCTACGSEKSEEAFSVHKVGPRYYRLKKCKECVATAMRVARATARGVLPQPSFAERRKCCAPGMDRRCKKCGTDKLFKEFTKQQKSPSGHSWTCKACSNAATRERYAADPSSWERKRERTREEAKRRTRKWYAENKARANAASAAYRAVNRDALNAYWKEWKKRNPIVGKVSNANRRACAAAASGSYSEDDVLRIIKAQRNKCACCRQRLKSDYEVDHIKALSRGGSNDRRNIQVLCKPCNRRKHSKDQETFMRGMGFLL